MILRSDISTLLGRGLPRHGSRFARSAATVLANASVGSKSPSKPGVDEAFGAPVQVLGPLKLADHFRPKFYDPPTGQQQNLTQHFFNNTHFRLESVVGSHKGFGSSPSSLPEVLFVGHTNVGKSSLIEAVMSGEPSGTKKNLKNLPRIGKQHGFTRTLNFYNIGGKFRLVDSPGYGRYGLEEHGNMVLEYLEKLPSLRRVFVLVDGVEGVRSQDGQIINFLVDHGIPFEIVFTKTDSVVSKYLKLKKLKASSVQAPKYRNSLRDTNSLILDHYTKIIRDNGLDNLGFTPRLLFSNCSKSTAVKHKYGYKEVRVVIMQSCNLLET